MYLLLIIIIIIIGIQERRNRFEYSLLLPLCPVADNK